MQLIALHGPIAAGKDTIADYLVEQFGFLKFGFSDALYREVAEAFDVSIEFLLERGTKEVPTDMLALRRCKDAAFVAVARKLLPGTQPDTIPLSPRWVLQRWGTEYRRGANENYWVEQFEVFLQAFTKSLEVHEQGQLVGYREHAGIVVRDTRFENEREAVTAAGGQVWHVYRFITDIIPAPGVHSSAQPWELRTGDKLILNFGDVPDLNTGVTLAIQGNDIVNTLKRS